MRRGSSSRDDPYRPDASLTEPAGDFPVDDVLGTVLPQDLVDNLAGTGQLHQLREQSLWLLNAEAEFRKKRALLLPDGCTSDRRYPVSLSKLTRAEAPFGSFTHSSYR